MAQSVITLVDDYAYIDLSSIVASAGAVYVRVLEYTPRTPEEDQTFIQGATWEASRLAAHNLRNVVESARVQVFAPTVEDFRTWVRGVESFFTRAKRYQVRRTGNNLPRIVFQANGVADTAYSSPCISGRVDYAATSLGLGWRNSSIEVLLTWTRAPYWEGSEVVATIRNPQATTTIAGFMTVTNKFAGSAFNAVDILNVGGSIPTPLKVEVTSVGATAQGVFWLANWAGDGNPASFDHQLEAEGNPGMSSFAGAAYSAGFYGQSASLPANGESMLLSVTHDAASLEAASGRYFRVLMNVVNGSQFPVGTRYRLALKQDGEYSWFGPYMRTPDTLDPGGYGDSFVDWGIVQLPPEYIGKWLGTGAESPAPITVEFYIVPTTTRTFAVDYVLFLPTDSIRQYIPLNVTGLAPGDTTVDEGMTNSVFDRKPPAGAVVQTKAIGDGVLMAEPGGPNRLYIALMAADRSADPSRTASIQVSYRPRRLSL
jgi:hypothetical protein